MAYDKAKIMEFGIMEGFYILKTIKRFSLNYDIILHNKNNSAFILSNKL